MFSPRVVAAALCSALLTTGCATVPYVGQGPNPQIERGQPFFPVDAIGNIVSLPSKLLLLNWRVDNHAISEETERILVEYLKYRPEDLRDLKIRINQWAPFGEFKHLWANKKVAWPYRLLIGLPVTLVFDVLLPGRLLGGDHYNPYTNTVHLYSDLPPIEIHEAGHALDFSKQKYPGTYAALRFLPLADLYQEFKATDEAIAYFIHVGDRKNELSSYKILHPAFGTYVGRYFTRPYGLIFVAMGHLHGRKLASDRAEVYRRLDAMKEKERRKKQGFQMVPPPLPGP